MDITWKSVRFSKLKILLFYFFIIFVFYFWFIQRVVNKSNSTYSEAILESLPIISISAIPLIIIPIIWIFKKSFPKQFILNKANSKITVLKSNDGVIDAEIQDISYSFHQRRYYSVLIIFTKRENTRGYTNHLELADFVSLINFFPWKNKTLLNIHFALRDAGIEFIDKDDKNIFDRAFL